MANPMYGQNKSDSAIDNLSKIFRVLEYKVPLDDTGVADGSAVVTDGIPANFTPIWCKVSNAAAADGGVVLHSGAAILDVETSGDKLCQSLSSLAAGASVASLCETAGITSANVAVVSSAKDILAEAAALKCNTSAGTVITITILGIDSSVDLSHEG